jgi:hypothetical protein
MQVTTQQRHDIIREFHHLGMRLCQEALYESDRENYQKKQNQYIFNLSYDA